MKPLRLMLVVIFCSVLVPAFHATEAEADGKRAPSQDTYADGQAGQQDLSHDNSLLGTASVSFPTAQRLTNSFLKFDVSYSGTLSKATLWLHAIAVTGAAHSLGLYAVSDDSWKENTLTWNNQPGLGSRLATSPASAGWLIFDVTSFVRAEGAADGVASFGLVVEPPYDFIVDVFEDRENSGGSGNRPYLVLETDAGGAVSSFTAEPELDHIQLAWTTTNEDNLSGFNLYRALVPDGLDGGTAVQLNQELIPADGDPLQGSSYEFPDDSVVPGLRYYYWLETVAEGGPEGLYGPISATLEVWYIYLPILLRN